MASLRGQSCLLVFPCYLSSSLDSTFLSFILLSTGILFFLFLTPPYSCNPYLLVPFEMSKRESLIYCYFSVVFQPLKICTMSTLNDSAIPLLHFSRLFINMLKQNLILSQIPKGIPGQHRRHLLHACLLMDLEGSSRFVKKVFLVQKLSGLSLSLTYLSICPLILFVSFLCISLMHQDTSGFPDAVLHISSEASRRKCSHIFCFVVLGGQGSLKQELTCQSYSAISSLNSFSIPG